MPYADDAFVFQATKIHQRTFGNDHPITARSLELMASVYAEIGKTEYSGKNPPGATGISPCWENNTVGAENTHRAPLSLYRWTLSAFSLEKGAEPLSHEAWYAPEMTRAFVF